MKENQLYNFSVSPFFTLHENVRYGSFAGNTLSREPVRSQLNPSASSKNYIPNFEICFQIPNSLIEKGWGGVSWLLKSGRSYVDVKPSTTTWSMGPFRVQCRGLERAIGFLNPLENKKLLMRANLKLSRRFLSLPDKFRQKLHHHIDPS